MTQKQIAGPKSPPQSPSSQTLAMTSVGPSTSCTPKQFLRNTPKRKDDMNTKYANGNIDMNGAHSSHQIMKSVSMPDHTTSIGGMDVFSSMKFSSHKKKRVRRERYDPCCCPPSPSARLSAPISFDLDVRPSPNRQRAQSEYGLKSSPRVRNGSSPRTNNGVFDWEVPKREHNRRRAYSSGPLIGTTVLVGSASGGSLSDASDETVSSLETSRKGKRPELKLNIDLNTEPLQQQQQRQNLEPSLSLFTIPVLPSPARTPRRQGRRWKSEPTVGSPRNSSHTSHKLSSFVPTIPALLRESRTRQQMQESDIKSPNPVMANACGQSVRKPRRRLIQSIHLGLCISFGMIMIIGTGMTSTNSYAANPTSTAKDNDLGHIRTVKDFSGEWGLTLTDTAEEEVEVNHGNSRVRKKRQPRLAEANTLSTQHLSSKLEFKRFVLTDDEIKKKTTGTSLDHDSFGKNRNSGSWNEEFFSGIFKLLWVCLWLFGGNVLWRGLAGQSRLWRLQVRRAIGTVATPSSPRNHCHVP